MTQRTIGRPFPRGALLGAGALVAFTLISAGGARLASTPPVMSTPDEVAEQRVLHFADQPDGSVAVLSATDGKLVARLAPGTNGFVRALMRGLARDRRKEGIGSEPPFTLALKVDGHLILEDAASGRVVDLGAFGPSNAQAFAALLDADGSGS